MSAIDGELDSIFKVKQLLMVLVIPANFILTPLTIEPVTDGPTGRAFRFHVEIETWVVAFKDDKSHRGIGSNLLKGQNMD